MYCSINQLKSIQLHSNEFEHSLFDWRIMKFDLCSIFLIGFSIHEVTLSRIFPEDNNMNKKWKLFFLRMSYS